MNKLEKMNTAHKNGIKIPYIAMRASDDAGIPFAVMCAFLEQESSGGDNVFGHDPTIFVDAGKVTKNKFVAYRKMRRAGKGMQGVGPMQLTWWEFQDKADELGGCWVPYNNCLVGARLLSQYRKDDGSWWKAAKRYNGSASYADQVSDRITKWKNLLA